MNISSGANASRISPGQSPSFEPAPIAGTDTFATKPYGEALRRVDVGEKATCEARATKCNADRQREIRKSDQARHLLWAHMVAGSYALDTLFLAFFASIRVISWSVPLLYAVAAAVVCLAHHIILVRNWNLSWGDSALIGSFTCIGVGLQVLVVAAAPQIAFPYIANVFTVFAIGTTWLGLRQSVMIWSGGTIAIGVVFYWVGARISAATASPSALLLSWLYFSVVLSRLLAVSAQATAMRLKLAKNRERLSASLVQIEELVHYDDLTKAFNRRSLMVRLAEERSRADRTGVPFTVAIFDLDHFKQVNDRHGHAAGDSVLQAFVETVHETMRETDFFGRFGGEEFVLLLNATPIASSATTLERIRRAVAARSWDACVPGLKVTFSAGVAGYRPAESVTELLGRADAALYQAKNTGRNRVVVA